MSSSLRDFNKMRILKKLLALGFLFILSSLRGAGQGEKYLMGK
jgi:hypothetical protein